MLQEESLPWALSAAGARPGPTGGRSPESTRMQDLGARAAEPRAGPGSRYGRATRRRLPWGPGMGIILQNQPLWSTPARQAVRKATVAWLPGVRKEENAGSVEFRKPKGERNRVLGGTAATHLRQAPAGNRAVARGKAYNPRSGDPTEVSSPAGSN